MNEVRKPEYLEKTPNNMLDSPGSHPESIYLCLTTIFTYFLTQSKCTNRGPSSCLKLGTWKHSNVAFLPSPQWLHWGLNLRPSTPREKVLLMLSLPNMKGNNWLFYGDCWRHYPMTDRATAGFFMETVGDIIPWQTGQQLGFSWRLLETLSHDRQVCQGLAHKQCSSRSLLNSWV